MTGRDHSLTDTMMLISIDKGTRKVAIVSVPRDTSNFSLYYGGAVGPTFKLNTLLNAAAKASFGSPDPPMKTLENEIGFLVGIPVNYYAELDLNGFSKMIDALGGIDIVNQRAINDPATGIVMAAGPVHLDGPTAMLYVRSRENGGSDYLRAARQQALLVAIERKATSPAGLLHLGTLLSLTGKTIATDFPLSTARTYVSLAQHVSIIESCVLGPPYSSHPDTVTTGGTWTSRLDLDRVANLSVEMFGEDSRYYGQPGVAAAVCGK
jgi:LCP family protein required for cell wall assembly